MLPASPASEPASASAVRDVFLSELPLSFSEADVRQLCAPIGAIRNVKLFKPRQQMQGRYAFVKFCSMDVAQQCINRLNGHVLAADGGRHAIKAKWANVHGAGSGSWRGGGPPQYGTNQCFPQQQHHHQYNQFPAQRGRGGYRGRGFGRGRAMPPEAPAPPADADAAAAETIRGLEDSLDKQKKKVQDLEAKLASLESLDVDRNLRAIQRLRGEVLDQRRENSEVRNTETLNRFVEHLRKAVEVRDQLDGELLDAARRAIAAYEDVKAKAGSAEEQERLLKELVDALAAYMAAFPREEMQKRWRQTTRGQTRLCAAFPFLTDLRPKPLAANDVEQAFKDLNVTPEIGGSGGGCSSPNSTVVVAQKSDTALKDLLAGLKCTQSFLCSSEERLPGLGGLSKSCLSALETELRDSRSANADLIDHPQLELLASALKHAADSLREHLVDYNAVVDAAHKLEASQPEEAACLHLLGESVPLELTLLSRRGSGSGDDFCDLPSPGSPGGAKTGKSRKSPSRTLFNGLSCKGINTIQEEEEDDEEKTK